MRCLCPWRTSEGARNAITRTRRDCRRSPARATGVDSSRIRPGRDAIRGARGGTTEDERKDLIIAFLDAVTSGDGATFSEILAPDHSYHGLSGDEVQETPESGAEGASAWDDDRTEAIKDLSVTVDPIIADGDLIFGPDDVNRQGIQHQSGHSLGQCWLLSDRIRSDCRELDCRCYAGAAGDKRGNYRGRTCQGNGRSNADPIVGEANYGRAISGCPGPPIRNESDFAEVA